MIRGRLSCLCGFAAALWGVLYLGALSEAAALSLAAGALLAAAAAFPLLELPNLQARRWGLLLLFLGLGALAGFFRLPPAALRGPAGPLPAHPGLPLEAVAGFSGSLAEDSYRSQSGATLYRVRLRRVWSEDGRWSATARGQALVWAEGGQALFMGQELSVQGGLRPAASFGPAAYESQADPARLRAGGFTRPVYLLRARLFRLLQARLAELPGQTGGLLQALLLGSREGINPELEGLFRRSGTLHLLALSGLHVGILYLLAAALLSFLRDRRLRLLGAALLLLLYLFLIGWKPSLERAVIMLLAGASGFALDRDTQPLNLLALAAVLLLLLRPYYAGDLSFQLSFLALLGLLLVASPLQRLLRPYLPRFLALPLGASVGAQIATAPLLLARFGALYPGGVLASLVLIPLVTLLLWTGLSYLLLAVLALPVLWLPARGGVALLPGAPAGWVAWVLAALYGLTERLLRAFERLPGLWLSWSPLYWALLLLLLVPPLVELLRPKVGLRC
jgi:ComEC/Rec2-related protein